jgi:hypothetical protein
MGVFYSLPISRSESASEVCILLESFIVVHIPLEISPKINWLGMVLGYIERISSLKSRNLIVPDLEVIFSKDFSINTSFNDHTFSLDVFSII